MVLPSSLSTTPVLLSPPFGPQGARFTTFHASPHPRDCSPALPAVGRHLCITDIQPGGSAPMHRTQSVDYAVVLNGEIVLALDNGDERTMKAGEFMVQRGANHALHNRTGEVCRIAVVMVGTEKIVLEGGKVLEESRG
ncbi:hypothetical protein B0H14DRAFT_3739635 [Mycena olivaceomarginata]|nr:hypothetical protein B0H14DRAFT_3739635 [Mycena olivaceomarginata]